MITQFYCSQNERTSSEFSDETLPSPLVTVLLTKAKESWRPAKKHFQTKWRVIYRFVTSNLYVLHIPMLSVSQFDVCCETKTTYGGILFRASLKIINLALVRVHECSGASFYAMQTKMKMTTRMTHSFLPTYDQWRIGRLKSLLNLSTDRTQMMVIPSASLNEDRQRTLSPNFCPRSKRLQFIQTIPLHVCRNNTPNLFECSSGGLAGILICKAEKQKKHSLAKAQ